MRRVSSLSITPETAQVVKFGGQIQREDHWHELRWTESRDGYVDVDYRSGFPDLESALKYAAEHFT